MTKNLSDPRPNGEQSPMKNNLTVTVLDVNGRAVGKTYPKRAKGLVKKGRAEALTENVIRLRDIRPHDITEENSMDNNLNKGISENTLSNNINADNTAVNSSAEPVHIPFDPREWYPNPKTLYTNSCERLMYNSFDGARDEIFSLGSFNGNRRPEIISRLIPVEPGGDYSFTFWLNGGENDRGDDICRLLAIYTDFDGADNSGRSDGEIPEDDMQRKYTYVLNRGQTPFLKELDGWYLFEISLPKPDKKYLELRFCAENAPMALRHADRAEAYKDLENKPDPYAEYRPQRHNIFFRDGWPEDKPGVHGNNYSTGAIKRTLEEEKAKAEARERDKAEWKRLIEEKIENIKKNGYNSGTLVINGVTVSNIEDLDSVDTDAMAEKFVRQFNDRLGCGSSPTYSFESAPKLSKRMKRTAETIKSLKDFDGTVVVNGVELNISDLIELADQADKALSDGENRGFNPDAVSRLDRMIEQITPFAEHNYHPVLSALKTRLEQCRDAFAQGNDSVGFVMLKRACIYARPARKNPSFLNGVRINDIICDMELLRDELKSKLELSSKRAHGSDYRDPEDGIDYDELAETVAENIDIDDVAENIDLEELADNLDMEELAECVGENIAENIDLDDLAESLDMDELAEKVAEEIDYDELAETVAENIDIDDVAENIDLEELADNLDMDELAECVGENIAENIDLDNLAESLDMDELAEKVAEEIDYDELAEAIVEKIELDEIAEAIAKKLRGK